MSSLLSLVTDTFPANDDTGVPLKSNITITLAGVDYDEDSLLEGFFLEGPDTDQYVGPGLLALQYPSNVSQGNADDFFESPGRYGLVAGTTTVTGISGNTLLTFNPTLPLAASVVYTANLTGVYEADATTEISGHISFSFTSGSGSIEEVPSTVSTSVLILSNSNSITSSTALSVISTVPADHAIEQSIELDEIVIEFNKVLNAASVTSDKITIEGTAVSSHPNLSVDTGETLAKNITVANNKITISI